MINKSSPLTALLNIKKPIIGMIHALPTAGSPKGHVCNIDELYDHGIKEAKTLITLYFTWFLADFLTYFN